MGAQDGMRRPQSLRGMGPRCLIGAEPASPGWGWALWPRAYTISPSSVEDTMSLLECLGQIRSLLIVQMGPQEENLMIQSIG